MDEQRMPGLWLDQCFGFPLQLGTWLEHSAHKNITYAEMLSSGKSGRRKYWGSSEPRFMYKNVEMETTMYTQVYCIEKNKV